MADGLICQLHGGGLGGVSESDDPEADRIRPMPAKETDGGVPIANCTAGGEIELMSQALLLLRRSERFMFIGCERGMEPYKNF